MTPEHRDHLRALAARVRTEEPSDELRDAALIARLRDAEADDISRALIRAAGD